MLGFMKKKKAEPKPADVKVNSFGEPLDKLVDDDLPWGWVTHYKDFIDKATEEYKYFLHAWFDVKKGDPQEERNALKSLLQYMDDVQKLSDQKGECFGFWCSDYLIGNQKTMCEERLAVIEKTLYK